MTVSVTSGGTVPGPAGAAGAAGPTGFPLPLKCVATRSSIYKQGFSNAGATSHHVMRVEVDASDLIVCYGNFGWGGAQSPVNDLLVDAALVIPGQGSSTPSRIVPFTFPTGSTARVSMQRGMVYSLPLGEDVKRGDVIAIRTYYRGDTITATGDTTNGSGTINNVTVTSGQVGAGQPITGAGIPANATIATYNATTRVITLNGANTATATASGVTLTMTALAPNDWYSDTGNGAPWYQTGNHLLDATNPAVVGGSPEYNNTFYYSPVGLYSRRISPSTTPHFALLGDSNFHGQGDDETPPATSDLTGLARRALNDRWPYIHLAESGMGIVQIAEGNRHPVMALIDGCDYLIIGMVTNDFGTARPALTIAADVNTVAGWAKQRGVKAVIACTAPPNTASTDSWATLANQTPFAQENLRNSASAPIGVNRIYRTLANMNTGGTLANIDWIADCASAVEVDAAGAQNANGDRWNITAGQSFGTSPHYRSKGHIAAAALIDDAITHVLAGERGGISKAF